MTDSLALRERTVTLLTWTYPWLSAVAQWSLCPTSPTTFLILYRLFKCSGGDDSRNSFTSSKQFICQMNSVDLIHISEPHGQRPSTQESLVVGNRSKFCLATRAYWPFSPTFSIMWNCVAPSIAYICSIVRRPPTGSSAKQGINPPNTEKSLFLISQSIFYSMVGCSAVHCNALQCTAKQWWSYSAVQ